MYGKIITKRIGTNMGTNEEKLLQYQKLWNEFEDLLEKENLNLSSFAKKWEKWHIDENSDYKKFYNYIKQKKKNLKILKNAPQSNTILQMEEYIKFLNNKRVTFEALDDEKFGNLF